MNLRLPRDDARRLLSDPDAILFDVWQWARINWITALLWATPVLVAAAVYKLSTRRLTEVLGLAVGLAVFAVFVRFPGPALMTLAVFLPAERILFGLLLKIHVPASVLRPSSSFKELLGICVLVAALKELRDGRARLDRIDKALLFYVAAVTAYLIVPHLFSPSAPSRFSPRILAWRADCGYVLMFFAVRHAPIPVRYRKRFLDLVLILGAVTVACALFEKVATATWTNFMFKTAEQPRYLETVTNTPASQLYNSLRYLYSESPLHVGSIFVSPYDMSDFLVVVGAIAAERIARLRRQPWMYLLLGGVVAAIFFSRVRADALALVIILVLAVIPAPRRPVEGRIRLILALVIGAAIVVPSLAGTRFVGGKNAGLSTSAHIQEIDYGISVIQHNPLGLGLGDEPATANQYGTTSSHDFISDNSITQVGDELGLQALIPWLVFVALVFAGLARRSRDGDEYATAAGLALLAVMIAGQYHHVFLTYSGPWITWAVVAMALPGARPNQTADQPSDADEHAPLPAY